MHTLRTTAKRLGFTGLVLLVLGTAIAWWSTLETSLATSLQLASRLLPSGQTLEVQDVSGSLWYGGSLRSLHWQQGALSVALQDVQFEWDVPALLHGTLRVTRLQVGKLRIDDQRPARPPVPPQDLVLPWRVDVNFAVQTLEWAAPPATVLTGISGHYVFDSNNHILDAGKVQLSSGSYAWDASVGARGAMVVKLQALGSVQSLLPGSAHAVEVQAHATLEGTLGGTDATLALHARLAPDLVRPPKDAMQAELQAILAPWHGPLVTQATAHWQAVDLAALWPQAPATLLDGSASARPSGSGWGADLEVHNRLSGPWNLQRLPLERWKSRLRFADGTWTVESLQATLGGGQIEANGSVDRSVHWQGHAQLHGLNPASIDTHWAVQRLDGELSATEAPEGIAFTAQLKSSTRTAKASLSAAGAPIFLKNLQAKGRWNAPMVEVTGFTVDLLDARLQGAGVFDTRTLSAQAALSATWPGAQARLTGHLASASGQGDAALEIQDAALASRWLANWPAMANWFTGIAIRGKASAAAHWEGGWGHQGRDLRLKAHMGVELLEIRDAQAPQRLRWSIFDLQTDLSAKDATFDLATSAHADSGEYRLTVNALSSGQRQSDGQWSARLDTLQVRAVDTPRKANWLLQLDAPLAATWRHDNRLSTLEIAAGSLHLSGPAPGSVQLTWQPARWSQPASGLGSARDPIPAPWNAKGRFGELPLAWLAYLAAGDAFPVALQGDLMVGGQWDASGSGSDALQVHAILERTRGDVQLASDEAGAAPLPAGVRTARLKVSVANEQVQAELNWDSANAGTVQAHAGTWLQRQGTSWTWPANAPLEGVLRAQLPRLRVWSLLAPPGWRLRGTLDANATLSGTRGDPQWSGTLDAHDLAIRSVLDGVDFNQGVMRLKLEGDGLEIAELTAHGATAGGAGGGVLSITGQLRWPVMDPSTAVASRLRGTLRASAQGLRVSTRADQRLVVSGSVSAQLQDATLTLAGNLVADQAAFVLAQDTAPRLGDDVHLGGLAAPVADNFPVPAKTAPPGTRITPVVNITLDLGENFLIEGQGLVTRLAGKLALTTSGNFTPRLAGEIRTINGTYKAYGQQLDVEDGVLRFSGPYDNPALDILAIRPNLLQRVGVQISGTALSPVVRLYAEPDLPDAEKLSWLVTGRANAEGGAQIALLQQAAMAMLGRNGNTVSGGLAQSLGLDEISMGGLGSTTSSDGTAAAGATVKLGKRLAGNFYVAYERSVAGAYGTFYIFYDLTKRFTLRGQTGEQSAVDLIFTTRHD